MFGTMKYGALSGKTRAMFGRLLRKENYEELVQKKSVSEVVSYLKNNTHYRIILSDVDENNIHRGQLENLLKRDLVKDYEKLLRFTHGDLKKFIDLLYVKIEIESLKLIFRVFEAGHAESSLLEGSLLFLSKCDKLDIPKLALSRNLEEFLLGLKGTDYYDVLRPFASENNEKRLFSMEMALDLYYLRTEQTAFKKILSPKDAAIALEFAGFESDIFNIFWVYRSKTFYKADPEVIQSYILPLIYKLKRGTLDELIRAKNLEEFAEILGKTPYRFLFQGDSQQRFEHRYGEFIYKLHKRWFRRNPFSIACVLSYLRMKETELANIFSIIEGIRYRLSEENIKEYIIGIEQNDFIRERV